MSILLTNIVAVLIACSYHVTGIPVANFFPFQSTNGDTALPFSDDGSSAPTTLATPFAFFNETRPMVFVS